MRAAVLHEFGGTPAVEDFPDPEPRDGAEVVEVVAAALNPVDLRKASGTYHGGAPDPPYVVGSEAVVRRGDGSLAYLGSPVGAFGTLAERTLGAPDDLVPVPDGADPLVLAGLGVAGLAAWLGLERRAAVQPGETVLVLGATGLVGQVAVQAARLLGAGRVVGAGRSPDGLRRARELGADATVRLGGDDVDADLRTALDGGADVVIDPLWGPAAEAALRVCNDRGRLVQIGQSAGAEATLPSSRIRGQGLAILGHVNWLEPREARHAAYRRMAEHVVRGELQIDVERLPLDAAPDAWERQADSPHVKLVLTP